MKMKRLFAPFIIPTLFVVLVLGCSFGLTNVTEVQAETESSNLIKTLRKNGINVSEQTNYSKLVEKLQSMQIDVSEPHRNSVLKYLVSEKASDLIKIQTSKTGILTWHFHDVIFLKKDLIFAQFDDGEMFGGDILLKVISSVDEVADMKSLWNYH